MHGGRWQRFLTVAGMVGVVTAVLAGSAAGLMRHQRSAWKQVRAAPLFSGE